MIKVLNIISDTNIGGAGRVVLNYLKYRDKENFEISVAVPQGSLLKAPLTAQGIEVFEIPAMTVKSFDFGAIKLLKKLINDAAPDIVHTHGSLSGRIAARQCKKIVIYTRHSVFPVSAKLRRGVGHWLNGRVNEHYADKIIAVSPAAKQNLTDSGISPERVEVILNGVEPVLRAPDEQCRALRAQYGIAEGDFTAGILARLEEYKGHLTILDSMKELLTQGHKIKLLIAGTGAYEDEIKSRIRELGLSDNVQMLGFVSDVASLLSILDVQLNASFGTEATSLSLLEGMSMGLPAIVSDYGGNPWVIEDGLNGLVFKSEDASDLAANLRMLICDPAFCKKLSEHAVETYSTRFTGEIFAKNIEQAYIKATEDKKHGK